MIPRRCHVRAAILLLALVLFDQESTHACVPDSTTGLYGTETTYTQVVEYDYELTVQSNDYDLTNVTDTTLPALELKFGEVILDTLFALDCGDGTSSNVDGVEGLSTLAVDVIDTTTACSLSSSTATENTTCYVVNGELTIYMNFSSSLDYSTVVTNILEAGMENNDFVLAHADSIESVVFLTSTTTTTTNTTTNTTTTEQGWGEYFSELLEPLVTAVQNNRTLYWTLILSPFICLFGCFCVCSYGCNTDGGKKGSSKSKKRGGGGSDDDTESAAERGLGSDSDDGSDDDDGSDEDDDDGSDGDESEDGSDYSDYESD